MKSILILICIAVLSISGCAAMHTYSSGEGNPCERDGCWTWTQTPRGPAWCRLENGDKVCHFQ